MRRSSKQRTPSTTAPPRSKVRFEVWSHSLAVSPSAAGFSRVDRFIVSVSRRARLASSLPAQATLSAGEITAEWPDSSVLAMLVNVVPSQNERSLFDRKELTCTVRYGEVGENRMKVLSTCKIDLATIAPLGSCNKELVLDMEVDSRVAEYISDVKLRARAVVKLISSFKPTVVEDDLSDVDLSVDLCDQDSLEIDTAKLDFQTPIPPAIKVDYKPRHSPRIKHQRSWNSQLRGGGRKTSQPDGPFNFAGNFDPLGLLTVQVTGASSLSLPARFSQSESPIGIYCVLTINGGLTKAKTAVCLYKVSSQAPVVWDKESSEMRFYASRSRHLFLLCHAMEKTDDEVMESKSINVVDDIRDKATASHDCIGAASVHVMEIKMENGGDGEEKLVRLEPSGAVYLTTKFTRLPYRHPVSARGRVILLNAVDLPLAGPSSVSCFVRIDGKQQGSTSPIDSEEDFLNWRSEPVECLLNNAVDLEVHLWSSRTGGLANWCGYGVVPLASCLYEVGDEPAADSLSQCAKVTSPYEKTMWIDLEPKGRLLIQLGLNPTQVPFQFQTVERQDLKTKPKKRSLPQVGLTEEGKLDVVPTVSMMPVGRSFDSVPEDEGKEPEMPKERQRKKTASWSELMSLMKDRVELRKENEELKETLIAIKAELAESEFQKQKLFIQKRKLLGLLQKEKTKALSLAQTSTSLELQQVMNQTS